MNLRSKALLVLVAVALIGVTYGISRDQMMARHKANHIQVAYAKDAAGADKAHDGGAAHVDFKP